MKKRIISMILCLVMALSIMPAALAAPTEYKITVICENGTAKAVPQTAAEGESVFLEVYADYGYNFVGFESDVEIENGWFTMPARDVTVTAVCTKAAAPAAQYKITVMPAFGGSAFASVKTAAAGDTVALSAKPLPGFRFIRWASFDKVEIKDNSFVMPARDVTIYPVFEVKMPGVFKISFDGNGGLTTDEVYETKNDGTLAELPLAFRMDDYVLEGWYTAKEGGEKVTEKTVFYENTTLYAHWKYSKHGGFPTVSIEFNTNGGTAVKTAKFIWGTKIDLKKFTTERKNYVFDGWYTDRGLTNKAKDSFRIERNMTLYAKWVLKEDVKPEPVKTELPFTDVLKTNPNYEDIAYVYGKGLMAGVAPTRFDLNSNVDRAMAAAIVYRLAGEPSFMNDNVFDDVAAGSWYEKPVVWANGKGIVAGTKAAVGGKGGLFDPSGVLTREQLISILYRYAQWKGYDVSVDENTNFLSFNDFWDTHAYAKPAMMWALERGIYEAEGWDVLPGAACSRELFAVIIHNFCEIYVD